jgi:hypothetical protein
MSGEWTSIIDPVPRTFTDNPLNKSRVKTIKTMLEHYTSRDENDINSTLTDVLADIMIFCRMETDEEGEELDFDDICRVAAGHCEASFSIDSLEADTLQLEGYCHYDDNGVLHKNEEAESDTGDH